MGYSTEFTGALRFSRELTGSQLAILKGLLGEDCRDHPEWGAGNLYYIDLELLPDFSGIRWNGAEKTYHMESLVNVVIKEMRKSVPDFGLSGKFAAQGEDIDDRWELVIGDDGVAKKVMTPPAGTKITCPNCEQPFYLNN